MKREIKFSLVFRDMWQSAGKYVPRVDQLVKVAPAIVEMGCFARVETNGGGFEQVNLLFGENPNKAVRAWTKPFHEAGIQTHMLDRALNGLRMSPVPADVRKLFYKVKKAQGTDITRTFCGLNDVRNIIPSIGYAHDAGMISQCSLCITHSPVHTVEYYVNMAKELEKRGAHLLCIKDMSGLLKPYAAKKLVSTLKQEIGIPIHLHTHDTSGNQVAAYLMAAEAGVDIVDCAIDSMSSMTSQPSMNAVVTALQGQERDTGLNPDKLQALSDYWADVRLRYAKFEAGIKNPSTDIYRYEMPGGQYTNLKSQVESIGLGHQFEAVKEMYTTVNHMLGDIVKVTPSSKMVGDLAIFMVQNNLTPENIVERGEALTFPDSVVSYFKAEDLQKVVLKGEEPITCRPGELLEPIDFDKAREEVRKFYPEADDHNVISWCLYPKVVEDFYRHRQEYGYIMRMGSHVFFNGMALGETNKINIEDGKTLVIKYLGLGDLNEDGTRNVQFELNGMRREVAVPDKSATAQVRKVNLADPSDKSQVGASIPGMVSKVNVKPGDTVEENQVLAVIEAMKMETSVVARMKGTVDQVLIKEGGAVKAGELLITIK